MHEEMRFLSGLQAHPEDQTLRLVYADWLEEQGDARCDYLRTDVELQELLRTLPSDESGLSKVRQLRTRLTKLGKTLDAAWVRLLESFRLTYVHCRVCKKVLLPGEAIDTDPRNFRKLKTTRYCSLCYEDAVRGQLRRASAIGRDRRSKQSYHGPEGED